ncbi:MAG TPA: bifunctional phosphopantothenoylcysteine decarboxylase/phosphopantothenate--cysteine ligase CoaBC [Solirubrobacteraceae bacterium]|jgi:phosphopantothenoylcysteine decarboxylase/phosphopantothenate--cysteine ligase|nr:bifunctional phosphopantothenoylcysteine decarboxylase/phosphopantothenate--cysteine ligase CoaBC [Solirubrobacteraceae bacterium]
MARILLGVTGGIAAYKALEFVRLATGSGHAVRVIQTPASERFVGRASFAGLTGARVLVDEHDEDPLRGAFPGDPPPSHAPVSHLELVANADVLLVAPASANTLAKLAHGLADNLLTSAALAACCPVVLAPAMNNRMYEHPATQANIELLRGRGATILEPGSGRLGSPGEWGVGRLVEPAGLLLGCEAVLGGRAGSSWTGLQVLVSAGGTREPIDAVRYLANNSSGRMGFALADAAAGRGAQVTVVAANVGLARNPAVRYVAVSTAAELELALEAEFDRADVLLMAAAVADFRPARPEAGKLSKEGRGHLSLALEPTPDILTGLAARRRPDQTVVGFAAEHGDGGLARARAKLSRKRLDAVVLNDVSTPGIGFDSTENEVTIVTSGGDQEVARAAKLDVARAVLDAVDRLRGG